ncbi:MAG: agmatinase family protein [Candidatus Amoebophilus sp.]
MKLFSHTNHMPTTRASLFHTNVSIEEASLIVIPAPWEVTVSTRSGTALGPETILKASYQLGLYSPEFPNIDQISIAMLPIPHDWKILSDTLRHDTAGYIHALELGIQYTTMPKSILQKINSHTRLFLDELKNKALNYLNKGKIVSVVGGEHIVALGLVEALTEKYANFGILHLNAHATLHKAYQGFTYSHASLMHNVLKLPQVETVVQIGLRDYTKEEAQVIDSSKGRIITFLNDTLKAEKFQGITWDTSCKKIIDALPEHIYISFDIDSLDASLCPSTGSPVPGGLGFDEVCYLFKCLVNAGKKVIGFDLCEVSPGEQFDLDAQVGSRMLYQLALTTAASQNTLNS